MDVLYPSSFGALVEAFNMASQELSFPGNKDATDSKIVVECKKLFIFLSDQCHYINMEINKVLDEGGYLPNILMGWASKARELINHIEKDELLSCEESVQVGREVIDHLEKFPLEDQNMYDKPIREIIIVQTFELRGSEPVVSSANTMWIGEVSDHVTLAISPQRADSHESIINSVEQTELQSTAETTEEPENMQISETDFNDSQQAIESDSYGEIKADHEISTLEGRKQTDEVSQHETLSVETQTCYGKSIPKNECYSFIMADNCIQYLVLDDGQTIELPGCPSSSGQLENSSVINLVKQDLIQLPEKPNYSNPYLLFLQKNIHLTHIPDLFFVTMPNLCFLDMSDTRIKKLPSSLFKLSKLKVLMLRNCVCLVTIPSKISKLTHMEVLDLSGTQLYNLPGGIFELKLLRHMHLSFYGPDDETEYVHLPRKLISFNFSSSKIENLEALTISVHPEDHRWTKTAEQIIKKHLYELKKLRYLQFYFPEVKMFEYFIEWSDAWKNRTLSHFRFVVGQDVKRIAASRVPNETEQMFGKEKQSLRFVNGNADQVPQMIQNVLARATGFYLDHHIKVESLSEFGISNFVSVKFCLLRECTKIRTILDNSSTEDVFPCLEHLRIYYLWELEHICKSPSTGSSCFPVLTHLTVSTCRKLQFVLWESMLQCLSNLKELVVEDCESVEVIVKQETEKFNYGDLVIMLPGLSKLVLQYLPELVSLGNGMCLPTEIIHCVGCPKFIMNLQPEKQTVVKQRAVLLFSILFLLLSLWGSFRFAQVI